MGRKQKRGQKGNPGQFASENRGKQAPRPNNQVARGQYSTSKVGGGPPGNRPWSQTPEHLKAPSPDGGAEPVNDYNTAYETYRAKLPPAEGPSGTNQPASQDPLRGRELTQEEIDQVKQRLFDAYDAIPESDRPSLTDEELAILSRGRPNSVAGLAGASSRSEREKIAVGYYMRHENQSAQRQGREPRPSRELINEVLKGAMDSRNRRETNITAGTGPRLQQHRKPKPRG